MTTTDFWTHIKDSMPMASLGALINFIYGVLPVKNFKSFNHFVLIALTRMGSLILCILTGLICSYMCKALGEQYIQYTDVASALGALGGKRLLDIMYKLFYRVGKKYLEKYEEIENIIQK